MPGTARDERLLKPLLCRSLQISTVLLRLLGFAMSCVEAAGKAFEAGRGAASAAECVTAYPCSAGTGGSAPGSRVPAAGARLCWERAGGQRQFELTTPHLPWAKGIIVCRLPSAATL